ncbi:MAG TPA: peptidase S41, partial [Prevotellaceae bacterium]|nr:peptidase S41 [Prevotellaceae bacterium]
AKYYTPSGRCIQKPYEKGDRLAYARDVINRYNSGELTNADSIHFPDSLRYQTLRKKRTVYGGGGIMPDYFVPLDTTKYSRCYRELSAKSLIINASLKHIDQNRKPLRKSYPTFAQFRDKYQVPQALVDSIMARGERQDIKPKDDAERAKTEDNIRRILKALVARDLWDMSEYFCIIYEDDEVVRKAVELLAQ